MKIFQIIKKFFFLIIFIFSDFKNLLYLIFSNTKKLNELKICSILSNNIKFKDDFINKFLFENKRQNKTKKKDKRKKILIELLLPHHSEPMIINCLIAKDISKIYDCECVGLINKNDILTKEIAKSYGINEFIYIDKGNFLFRIFIFIKALNLINFDQIKKNLYNFKYDNLELGKSALEHYLRFHNFNPQKKNVYRLYDCLYKSLINYYLTKKIFNYRYKYFVLGETQFIPNKILFHVALKKKIPVYTWKGTGYLGHCGRIINSYKDRNSIILQYSKKFSHLLLKIYKSRNILKILINKGFINDIGLEPTWAEQQKRNKINFKNKNEFFNYFKLEKKKNILILPHAMSDNLFNNNWNIFHTAYHWFYETISHIQNINDVNWIIKPHPYEFKFSGISARKIFEELGINNKNIIFLKEDMHINHLYKYVDAIITGNGSAAYEYTSLGIPSITTSDATYSNFNFTYAPKNKSEYFSLLTKIKNISKLNKDKIKKAQIFWISSMVSVINSFKIIPRIPQHGKFKKKLFFKLLSKKNLKIFKKNSLSDDINFQLLNKNRHSININFIKKNNKNQFSLKDI